MKNRLIALSLILFLVLLSYGCASHKLVATPDNAETIPYQKTSWTFFWGNGEKNGGINANCPDNGMSNVTIIDNPGFQIIRTLSLGIVNPIRLKWHCTPERTTNDTIPDSSIPNK